MKTVATVLSALLCSTAVLAAKPDHKHVAKSLSKRFSGQATYYYVGLGACGKVNVASDFIVALNTPQYGYGSPGPQCFKTITISAGGKTASATIMDECPTCDYGSLDMSEGLFTYFHDVGVGEFPITWEFGGGGGGGDDTPPPKEKTTTKERPTTTHTTSTHHTTPTTTWQPPTTTTHSTTRTTPTTTKVRTTTTSTSTKKVVTTTTTSSSSAPATTTSAAPVVGNLGNVIEVILSLQAVLGAAVN